MTPIPASVSMPLWKRFGPTGRHAAERWVHECVKAFGGIELAGHDVSERTPTLVRKGDDIHAIDLYQGHPLIVRIGNVIHDTFVPRES